MISSSCKNSSSGKNYFGRQPGELLPQPCRYLLERFLPKRFCEEALEEIEAEYEKIRAAEGVRVARFYVRSETTTLFVGWAEAWLSHRPSRR